MRTSYLVHNSFDFWLSSSTLHNVNRDNDRMFFLQSLFTILWAIWNHRNKVLHQGKSPNPMEVMLTTQSLACRYREAFQKDQSQHLKFSNHPHQIPTNQGWQVIIKVAAFKNKKTKRSGWAYEVKTMDGTVILRGGESIGRKSSYQSSQEAVKEANFKSQELGFSKMLILFNTKRLVQICNQRRNPNWL